MKRDIGIDIIKFFAAILITNSHFDHIYPESLKFLSTGGAIGDALFFFCSGFTLFLKPMERFDQWYRKRISRIYPSVFACGIIVALLWNIGNNTRFSITIGGYWFISCIMLYYVLIWLIDRFLKEHLIKTFTTILLSVIVIYFLWNKPDNFNMYGNTYFKWLHFFTIMIFGAIIGKTRNKCNSCIKSFFLLAINIIGYYAILYLSLKDSRLVHLQILSLAPLMFLMYYMYSLFNSNIFEKIYNNKCAYFLIMFIGGLCLEIYLVQGYILSTEFNMSFPVKFITIWLAIFMLAYITRTLSRVFSQTFSENGYNWKKVFKIV